MPGSPLQSSSLTPLWIWSTCRARRALWKRWGNKRERGHVCWHVSLLQTSVNKVCDCLSKCTHVFVGLCSCLLHMCPYIHACVSNGAFFAFSSATSYFLFSERAGAAGRAEGPGGGEVYSSLSVLQCPWALCPCYLLWAQKLLQCPLCGLSPSTMRCLCFTTMHPQSALKVKQNFSPLSPDETDRQRKDVLRQKVSLRTLPPLHLDYFLFSVVFIFSLHSSGFHWEWILLY